MESLKIIKRNGCHLLDLINDILDLSKIEAGKQELALEACAEEILADVIATMRISAEKKALRLTVRCEAGIPAFIAGDPGRFKQILVNLVGNAVKFTESGQVHVAMGVAKALGEKPKLQVDVTDTGIGMTEQQMGLLFKPFSQVDGSARRRFGGSGLGLAISQRLARLMGGDITVRSKSGEGSTFSLTIALSPWSGQGTSEHSSTRTGRSLRRRASRRL